MKILIDDLNEVQRNAVVEIDGPKLVIAGAGSGKTRVLTYRIAYLLSKGVPPHKIMALTFTNKAAREMKERIGRLVSPELAKNIWMGTFHSIFSKILRYEAEILGYTSDFTIYDAADTKSLLKSIIKDKKLNDKQYKPGDLYGRISMAKNNLITADAYKNNSDIYTTDAANQRPLTGEIYKIYANKCKRANAMDFDDLLLYTNVLFRDFPEKLKKYQDRFSYILVDEYQDTNYSQYLIVKRLAEQHHNVCVVGDDAQSIYSFRGAKIENILNFRNDYPDYKLFKLEENYRSSQTIVGAANSVIAKNENQIQKTVYSNKDTGDLIRIINSHTDQEEGFSVAGAIVDSRYSHQLNYSDFAILYRTNAQSRIFEESLRKKNIPYRVYGSISFYQRKEIKDVLSYFRLMINPNDDEAVRRVINYPSRGIGNVTLEKLEQAADQMGIGILLLINKLDYHPLGFNKGTISKLQSFGQFISKFGSIVSDTDAFTFAQNVIQQTGILQDLGAGQTEEERSRIENIEELMNGIREYVESFAEEGVPSLHGFMENVALLTDADTGDPEDRDRVSIMTIHSAKGLEFEEVFIAGCEEELFPSYLSVSNPKDLEEERRLFYVAITRAKARVTLSHVNNRYKWGQPVSCSPSRFIKDIDPEFIQQSDKERRNFFQSGSVKNAAKSMSNPLNSGGFSLKRDSVKAKIQAGVGKSPSDFKADDPSKIQLGMNVEHERFGIGKVIFLEGSENDKKARIFFKDTSEEKVLLLRFAKLRIVTQV